MRTLISILFLSVSVCGFSQTKEDVVECLNLIFGQDEFSPAFTNDLTSNGAVVITSDGKRRLRGNKLAQIKSSLTQDDFYDFDHPVKVVVSGYEDLETLGISALHILNFFISGDDKHLNFGLDSFIKNENLKYTWMYNLIYENGEWKIVGRSLRKTKW